MWDVKIEKNWQSHLTNIFVIQQCLGNTTIFTMLKKKNTKLAVQHINTSNSNFETKMCVYISPKQQIQNKPKMLKPPRYGLSLTISLN